MTSGDRRIVVTAVPGTLPVLNWGCVEAAVRTGFALGGKVNRVSHFDRKHYFYADLPLGFQITQQDHPLVTGGMLPVRVDGRKEPLSVPIQRIQLEQDTGKSLHDQHPDHSLIDLNRAGSALMEVVTEPALSSGEEAAAFVRTFQLLLRHIGTSSANMEDGSLRVDVNVSMRSGDGRQSTRCEIKNMNSIRSIVKAVEFEAARHQEVLSKNEDVARETRTFDVSSGTTHALRSKESALDYRFMPEPDLPPLVLTEEVVAELERTTPELPDVSIARLQSAHGLSAKQAATIVSIPGATRYLLAAVELAATRGVKGCDAVSLTKWLLGDLRKSLNNAQLDFSSLPASISEARLLELLEAVESSTLSARMAKPVLEAMVAGDTRPVDVVSEEVSGGAQLTDAAALQTMCKEILEAHPKQVAKFLAGKNNMM
eukprot:gene9809-11622_t